MDKKMIRYTLLKAVQVLALVTLPIVFWTQSMSGNYVSAMFSLFVVSMYISDISDTTLEKKLHEKLY